LLPEEVEVKKDEMFEDFFYEEEFDGKEEYSISGWARWTDAPPIAAWHLLFRVT